MIWMRILPLQPDVCGIVRDGGIFSNLFNINVKIPVLPCRPHPICLPSVFCIYYISRGVLQENRQELVAFVLSVLVVMIRSVVNFSVVGSKGKQEVLVSGSTL